jgi:adenosylcobinamide kinase/adenosylcobinamide-phosphate guanylyltransferase
VINENSRKITLVTGAASSGKSEWAESLALKQDYPVVYIATAQSNDQDPEWRLKIEKHRQRRPLSWQVWEIPDQLVLGISKSPPQACILIDSLGTWVANLLTENEHHWQLIVSELLKTIENREQEIIFVAEETGWGVIPAYESGRLFRDRLGKLIRQIGIKSDLVYLVTGGYAIDISVLGEKLPGL